jgi:hypothetical protein
MENICHESWLLCCSTLGRRDSDSSGGMIRRGSHTTPVAAIQEGILDNGAIGACLLYRVTYFTIHIADREGQHPVVFGATHVRQGFMFTLVRIVLVHLLWQPPLGTDVCTANAEEGEEEGSSSSCSPASSVAAPTGDGDDDDDGGPGAPRCCGWSPSTTGTEVHTGP